MPTPSAIFRLLRPSDWMKNLLVLAAVVFGQRLTDPALWWPSSAAFVAFCLMASGSYAINDARDVDSDRRHRTKRYRPVASGEISVRFAWLLGLSLVLAGLLLGAAINLSLLSVCAAYVLLQIVYNLRLKRVQLIDVTAIAIGFVLRAAAGASATHIPLSIYLALCVFFLCMYLGFIKRLCDLASAGDGSPDWRPPANYDDRQQLNWMLAVSASLVVTTYVAYTLAPQTHRIFGPKAVCFALLSPLVLIGVHRFYLRANQGRSDRPLDALIEDRGLRAAVLLFVVGLLVTLYVPGVDVFVAHFFRSDLPSVG